MILVDYIISVILIKNTMQLTVLVLVIKYAIFIYCKYNILKIN